MSVLNKTVSKKMVSKLAAVKSNRLGEFRRSLKLERLESRAMLAGDVRVEVEDGTLFVIGDRENNAVIIEKVGKNSYRVTGVPDVDGEPTEIRGSDSGSRTVKGVTKDIEVNLKQGNDLLGIGSDTADLEGLLDELVGGSEFTGGSESQTKIRRNLEIEMGSGRDAVGLFVDVRENAEIDLGSGRNSLAIEDSEFGEDLLINGEGGSDSVRVRNSVIDDLLFAELRGDSDLVQLLDVRAGHIELDMGSADDNVFIDQLRVRRELLVTMETGADELTIDNARGDDAVLRGGEGDDDILNRGEDDFDDFDRNGFETRNNV